MYQSSFRWPDGAYIALTFDMPWEGWPDNLGTPASVQHSTRRPIPGRATYQRDNWVLYEHAFRTAGRAGGVDDVGHVLCRNCAVKIRIVLLSDDLPISVETDQLSVSGWK